ncbi:MAG: hypothetical protein ACLR8P_06395 [Clostridium fessum]
MEQQNITAVKGIGEKTAKLFQKIGVETVEELLHYYPRAYDEFKEPQPIAELKEDTIAAVGGIFGRNGGCGAVWSAPAGYDGWIAGIAEAHWRWHGTICPICAGRSRRGNVLFSVAVW